MHDDAGRPETDHRGAPQRHMTGKLNPVLVGSALRNIGVRRLLDAVMAFLPSPLDRPPIIGSQARRADQEIDGHVRPGKAVRRAGVQDHQRQTRGPVFSADLPGNAEERQRGVEHATATARKT